jgi:copper chaperone NosL
MSKLSRVLVAVAGLVLALLYVTPLWRIDLGAPQYPEGLGMRIWVHQIEGAKPNDLQNINGLNHYIGMAPIHPDEIAELRFMPWVVAGLIGGALLVAAVGKRALLFGFTAAYAAVAAVGLYDFWRWEYDYGHNLDPAAAIRIPGASYQPPLIGAKKILNFTAASWPDIGGIAAFVSLGLVLAAVALELRRRDARRATAAAVAPQVTAA